MLDTLLLASCLPFVSLAVSSIALPIGVEAAGCSVRPGGDESGPSGPRTMTITALLPSSIGVGAPQLLLTVQGSGFLAGAYVEFNNQAMPTTWISATELVATVPGAQLDNTGMEDVEVRNGAETSNSMTFTILNPVLTLLDPSAVLVGSPTTTVNLTGANFGSWSQVRYGTQYRPTTYIDENHLSIVLDQSELQNPITRSVQVDNSPAGPGGTSNTLQFTVANLLLSSLSPNSITVGSATFQLTATGQGFGANSQIRFDGHTLTTLAWTATSVTADVDAQYVESLGTHPVQVIGSATGGGTSNTLTFVVGNPAPSISSITPPSVLVGASTNYVILTGTGFVQQSDVFWNGMQHATSFMGSTSLRMNLSSQDLNAAGIAQIHVENPAPGGGASPAVPFAVNNPVPTIGSANPSAYQAGSAASTLTISGSNFNAQTAVDLDGVPLTVNSVNPNSMNLTVPATALAMARIASLTVTNPTPGGGSATVPLTIYNPVPTVASLSPAGAVVGSGAFVLAVSGTGFNTQSIVHWNNQPLPTTLVSSSQLSAAVDATKLTTLGYASVRVFGPAPGGGTSNAATFTIGNPVPVLTSLSPSAATTGSGAIVMTITGTSIVPGCIARWNGADIPTTFVNSVQVTATVSASLLASGGAKSIVVVNPAPGGGVSNALSFTVINPVPILTSVAPSTLPIGAPSAAITVTGSNFVGQSVVRCNTVPVATTWISTTTMTAIVPASFLVAAGTLSITVFTPTPGGGTSLVRTVTLVNPVPTLTNVTPMLEAAGMPVTVTAYGSGFNSQSRLRVTWPANPTGILLTPGSVSPTSLSVFVPAGYFGGPIELRLAVQNPAPGGGTSVPMPFAFAAPSTPVVDGNPVTFSVSGPVHSQTDGLRWPRGVGPSTAFAVRTPPVATPAGLFTPQPGDVQDYAMAFVPASAELFQSEPVIGAGRPSGTNNQILVADALGLVAGAPFAMARDNIDGTTFGEDWFGVTAVAVGSQPSFAGVPTPWQFRSSVFLPNIVTVDVGTSFRLAVNPYARGLLRTGVAIESLRFDDGIGVGPWVSIGDAASEVFGTPLLALPGVPPLGMNELVHDRTSLALAHLFSGATSAEDDIDALECIGDNDPFSWFVTLPAMVAAGDLHARTMELPLHGAFLPDGLAPPGVSIHGIGVGGVTSAPVFMTVDRRSTGKALSAVRTQWRAGEAAGDVFMVWNDNNLLLIDEQEAGLYPGISGVLPCDDMDALLLHIHPDDRYYLIELAEYHVPYSGLVVEHDPNPSIIGDEYRTGPGYSYSLLRYAWIRDARVLRMRLGFSVTTDSIGLEGTPVDYETGLDPSGYMQQAGDIYFTQFGVYDPIMGLINTVPEFSDYGTHYRWYEENEIGLEAGTWTLGTSPQDFALLPDELNGLDSAPVPPGGPGLHADYGAGCAGTGGFVPTLEVTGRATENRVLAFGISGGLAGGPCILVQGLQAVDQPFLPGCNLLVQPAGWVLSFIGLMVGSGPGEGSQNVTMFVPPGLAGFEFATHAAVFDSGGSTGFLATTQGVMVRIE